MPDGSDYWLTRFLFTRALGMIYLIAFVCALDQFVPLLGRHGLLPVPGFVSRVPFRSAPSLFYLAPQDRAYTTVAWIGIALSCAVITGLADRYAGWLSALIRGLIWLLYMSFVNVGQTFYAFGWETILHFWKPDSLRCFWDRSL
jgi:hypothetical protein